MKKLLIAGIILISVPFVSSAQTPTSTAPATGTITITNPGLLPSDFFYFLDRWSEVLNIAITFNKEKKALKHMEYAKERVAEINDILEDADGTLEDILSAKENFDMQIAVAAMLVKAEKDKGVDVAKIAEEFDDELFDLRAELKDIFKDHKDEYSRAEQEIRAKLASLSPTDPQVEGLTKALDAITKEKDESDEEEDDIDDDFLDEQEIFEDIIGKEKSAQKHIDEALRLKARLDGLAGQFPVDIVASQDLLRKAKEADARGDFEAAKQFSKQAKKIFEKAQDSVEEYANEKKEMMEDIDDSHIDDIEQEIKKGERMMEGFDR